MTPRRRLLARNAAAALLLLCAVLFGLWKWTRPAPPVRELMRSELDLRDGRLYATGETRPFTGRLVEIYTAERRKLEIEIHDGQAHGLSRGWYDDGQIEVEETFVAGISHGPRTRWHQNGAKKSAAQIVNGELEGPYAEWHENGQPAIAMTLHRGQPDGLVEAWHPSGALKSHVRFEQGRQVSRDFWPDPAAVAVAATR